MNSFISTSLAPTRGDLVPPRLRGFVHRWLACVLAAAGVACALVSDLAGACLPNITVISASDAGAGSLRQAILDLCPGGTIDFAPALNGSTIGLTSGELVIDKSLTILGPGADKLAIDGNYPVATNRVIHVSPGVTAAIAGLTITNGNTPRLFNLGGGGIWNERATLTVSNCTVTGNRINNSGGGIFNDGEHGTATMLVINSTVSGNSAGNDGGGVWNDGNNGHAALTLINSTVSGNTADTQGGAIWNYAGDTGVVTLEIFNSTLSDNSARFGGGISQYKSSLAIGNTILNNATGGNIYIINLTGTVTSHGYNLSSDAGGGLLAAPSDQLNTPPLLGPLQNNGGPTPTHALLPGSPAFNAGDPAFTTATPPPFDQRGPGFLRVVAGRVDIGAVELCPLPMVGPLADVVVCEGTAFAFSLSITSATPYTVQWFIEGYPLDGETNTTLSFPYSSRYDSAEYYAEISSECGSISNGVRLEVLFVDSYGLGDLEVCEGEPGAFAALVESNQPYTVAWLKDGAILPGETNQFLVVSNVTAAKTGLYSMVVSTACESITNTAELLLANPPTHPAFIRADAGLFQTVSRGGAAWGDFDNDGLPDLLMAGQDNNYEPRTILYKNHGNGLFTEVPAALPATKYGSVAWGDYDKDGFLDILLTGDPDGNGDDGFSAVFRNLGGTGGFTNIGAPLEPVRSSSAVWGDFNGDGFLDILLAGYNPVTSEVLSRLYTNTTTGGFADTLQTLPGLLFGFVAAADYDRDGRLDALFSGQDDGGNPITTLWRNTGGGVLTNSGIALPQLRFGAGAWTNVNADLYPDFIITGLDPSFNNVTFVFTNNGPAGGFTDAVAGLPDQSFDALAWGDYDGDGRPDLLLSSGSFTRVYHNDGGGKFSDASLQFPRLYDGAVAWVDFDLDGDLDIFVSGGRSVGEEGTEQVAFLYRNCSMHGGLCVRGAVLEPVCGHGDATHAVYLPGIATDFEFMPDFGRFMENADGTAMITGVVRSISNPSRGFNVSFTLSGLVSNAPPGSPKKQMCPEGYVENGGPINPATWHYYTGLTGVLTGIDSYTGAVVNLTRVGPAFQVGDGASAKNPGYGGSAWFLWTVVRQPASGSIQRTGQGDINVDIFKCDDAPAMSMPGCLVHYAFAEQAGMDALDDSGSGNHARLLNGPLWTNGPVGGAVRFDGSNDRVSATNATSLNVTGAFTIACWVRPESVSGSAYLVIKGNDGSDRYAYALRASGAKVQYRWVSPGGKKSTYGTTANVLAAGRWTHIAVVHTPGRAPVIFINGVAVPGSLSSGSAAELVGASAFAFSVGSSADGKSPFKGAMDEVFVCPGALVAAQIQNLTNGLPPGPPPPPPVPGIATISLLPGGTVGNGYSQTLVATGGTPGFIWSLVNGSLPGGLTLNTNTGVISGTPTAAETNTFRVRVSDALSQAAEKDFTLGIASAPAGGGCLVNYKFDEAGGTNAIDSTGSGNDGVLLNGPIRTNGMVGGALRFDGSNDRVNGGSASSLNWTGVLTVAVWVRPESVSGKRVIVAKGNTSDKSTYAWALRTSSAKLQFLWVSPAGKEAVYQSANNVLTAGRWTHVAVVHVPGSLPLLYTNGVLVGGSLKDGTATAARGTTANPLSVGASSDGGERFQGALDEVFACGSLATPADLAGLMLGLAPAVVVSRPLPVTYTESTSMPVACTLQVADGWARLSWTAAPGQTYRVQFKESLADGAWRDLLGEVYVPGGEASVEDPIEGGTQRFYRVVTQP